MLHHHPHIPGASLLALAWLLIAAAVIANLIAAGTVPGLPIAVTALLALAAQLATTGRRLPR